MPGNPEGRSCAAPEGSQRLVERTRATSSRCYRRTGLQAVPLLDLRAWPGAAAPDPTTSPLSQWWGLTSRPPLRVRQRPPRPWTTTPVGGPTRLNFPGFVRLCLRAMTLAADAPPRYTARGRWCPWLPKCGIHGSGKGLAPRGLCRYLTRDGAHSCHAIFPPTPPHLVGVEGVPGGATRRRLPRG